MGSRPALIASNMFLPSTVFMNNSKAKVSYLISIEIDVCHVIMRYAEFYEKPSSVAREKKETKRNRPVRAICDINNSLR